MQAAGLCLATRLVTQTIGSVAGGVLAAEPAEAMAMTARSLTGLSRKSTISPFPNLRVVIQELEMCNPFNIWYAYEHRQIWVGSLCTP